MEISYSDSNVYPVTATFKSEELVFGGEVGPSALDRIRDYLGATLGFDSEGKYNKTEDPFIQDLVTVIAQHLTALTTVEGIASGAFTSTAATPTYTPDGSRIFTPEEIALDSFRKIQAQE